MDVATAPLEDVQDLVGAASESGSGLMPGETPLERIFSLCTPEQRLEYEPERRSVRVEGHCTTIRLERAFWTVLEEISGDEGTTVPSIIAEVQAHCQHVNDKNLASCLRVICLKYINMGDWSQAAGAGNEAGREGGAQTRMDLDVRGLVCPQPILKAKKALYGLERGERLRVLTTDLSSAMDFETFCRAQGHLLRWVREVDGTYICLIEKG